MVGIENDETATRADKSPNFPGKIFLTDRQVANLCNAFASTSSANIKLSIIRVSEVVQSRGFFCRLLITKILTLNNNTNNIK